MLIENLTLKILRLTSQTLLWVSWANISLDQDQSAIFQLKTWTQKLPPINPWILNLLLMDLLTQRPLIMLLILLTKVLFNWTENLSRLALLLNAKLLLLPPDSTYQLLPQSFMVQDKFTASIRWEESLSQLAPPLSARLLLLPPDSTFQPLLQSFMVQDKFTASIRWEESLSQHVPPLIAKLIQLPLDTTYQPMVSNSMAQIKFTAFIKVHQPMQELMKRLENLSLSLQTMPQLSITGDILTSIGNLPLLLPLERRT